MPTPFSLLNFHVGDPHRWRNSFLGSSQDNAVFFLTSLRHLTGFVFLGCAMYSDLSACQVTLQSPGRKVIKKWFWFYTEKFLLPRLQQIALPLVVTYGAALCIDFSACDARQLRPD